MRPSENFDVILKDSSLVVDPILADPDVSNCLEDFSFDQSLDDTGMANEKKVSSNGFTLIKNKSQSSKNRKQGDFKIAISNKFGCLSDRACS